MDDNIESIDYTKTSIEEFRRMIEIPHRPIMIKNTVQDFGNDFKFSFQVLKNILLFFIF